MLVRPSPPMHPRTPADVSFVERGAQLSLEQVHFHHWHHDLHKGRVPVPCIAGEGCELGRGGQHRSQLLQGNGSLA